MDSPDRSGRRPRRRPTAGPWCGSGESLLKHLQQLLAFRQLQFLGVQSVIMIWVSGLEVLFDQGRPFRLVDSAVFVRIGFGERGLHDGVFRILRAQGAFVIGVDRLEFLDGRGLCFRETDGAVLVGIEGGQRGGKVAACVRIAPTLLSVAATQAAWINIFRLVIISPLGAPLMAPGGQVYQLADTGLTRPLIVDEIFKSV